MQGSLSSFIQMLNLLRFVRLHRCGIRRMFETKCVRDMMSDIYKMLVTVLAIFVTNIHYSFTVASGNNIQKMSPTSNFSHQFEDVFDDIFNRSLATRIDHQHMTSPTSVTTIDLAIIRFEHF